MVPSFLAVFFDTRGFIYLNSTWLQIMHDTGVGRVHLMNLCTNTSTQVGNEKGAILQRKDTVTTGK